MLNAKVLSCAMPTEDESNHSFVGSLHIHTAEPHA